MSRAKAPLASPNALRAAIYVRISKDRVGAGLGVDRQEGDCRKLGKKLGVTVVGVYVDNDTEASSGKPRKHYVRLLADMRAGLIDVVLVWHTDRLHRRPDELEEFITIAESRGTPVTVQACKAGLVDLRTPSGRMVARTLGAMARYEIEHKSERQKAANYQRAEAGKPTAAQRPFGFEQDGIAHRRREAQAIKKAAAGILAGESLHEVARTWNAAGLLTSRGREWNATTVRQVLQRPRNAALREYHGACVVDGQLPCRLTSMPQSKKRCEYFPAVWKPILPEEQWRALTKLFANPQRRTAPGNKPRWLLSGIAHCGYEGCDLTMRMATTSPGAARAENSRPIYRCRGGGHLSRSAPVLDDFISRILVARLSHPDAVDLLVASNDVDLTALHQEARALRMRKADWAADAAQEGGVDPAQLRIINAGLDARLREIDAALAEAGQVNVLSDLVGHDDVQKRWDEMSLDRRRAIVDMLMTVTVLPVGKGTGPMFDPSGIRVDWRTPDSAPVPRQRGNRVRPRAQKASGE